MRTTSPELTIARVSTVAAVLVGILLGTPAVASHPNAVASTRLAVYLVRGEQVAPLRRVAPRTAGVARAALLALLRGPTPAERRAGYRSSIPTDTRLRSVVVSRGVATVDLDRRFEAGGGSLSMLLRVAQVVHTATQFPTVRKVTFRLDGKPVDAIGGEGVVVSPPVGREGFEGQTPPILVEQPLPGDTVRSPIVVRGTANVFEGRLVMEIVSSQGRFLERQTVSASAGAGTRGRFDARIALGSVAARLRVVVYARSAKNGLPIDLIRIPVVYTR